MPPMPALRDLSPLQSMLTARPATAIRGLAVITALLVAAALAWSACTDALLIVPGQARVRPLAGPVRGFLDGSGLAAVAPHTGRIATIAVHDGQRVDAGAELFRLDTDLLDERIARADAELDGLAQELAALDRTAQLTAALRDAADARLGAERAVASHDRRRGVVELTAARGLAEIALAEARAEEARLAHAVEAGAAPAIELDRARATRARAAEEAARARAVATGDRRAVIERQRDEAGRQTELELARLATRRISNRRERRSRELERDAARRDRARAVVRAEVAGVVAMVGIAAPGAVVQAGEPVVTLTPDTGLRIDAAIPAREIARVAVGMPARVILDGRELGPRQIVHGRISYVGADSEVVALGGGSRGHVYLVSIEIADQPGLRAGMTGRTEIELGRQSVLSLAFARIRHAVALE